jgi:hypothetical protein
MAIFFFFNVKNPFVGFASPFFWWPDCENSPGKKNTGDKKKLRIYILSKSSKILP